MTTSLPSSAEFQPAIALLLAAHLRIAANFIRIDVDCLYHPIGVRSAGRGDQIYDRLAANFYRFSQDIGDKRQHIRPSRCFSLIVNEPTWPLVTSVITRRLDWPRAERHWLRRIRNVFFKLTGSAGVPPAAFIASARG